MLTKLWKLTNKWIDDIWISKTENAKNLIQQIKEIDDNQQTNLQNLQKTQEWRNRTSKEIPKSANVGWD